MGGSLPILDPRARRNDMLIAMNPNNSLIGALMVAAISSLLLGGCRNADGRFRPPDPIGYAIFEALDRGPREAGAPGNPDSDYIGDPSNLAVRGHPPSPDSIWVDGTWGTSNGRRVWIPAHWQ